jgi:hypothetical protein
VFGETIGTWETRTVGTHILPHRGAIAALSVLVALAVIGTNMADAQAEPTPEVETPTPDEQAQLIVELPKAPGPIYVGDLVAQGDLSPLSFDLMVPVYQVVYRPVLQGFSVRFEPRLGAASGELLMTVLRDGRVIGAIPVMKSRNGSWSVWGRTYGPECASALSELDAVDRVFRSLTGGRQAFLALRGESLRGIEACSDEPIPPVTTMDEYRQYLADLPAYFPGRERAFTLISGTCLAGVFLFVLALVWRRRLHRRGVAAALKQ